MDRSNAGSAKTAYYNVVCVIAGTGTLGLPFALRQGGWIGILILFLAWFMSTVSYQRRLLKACMLILSLSLYSILVSSLFDACTPKEIDVSQVTRM